jgi:toxin ParE1/3/4
MRVRWTAPALRDLEAIGDHIAGNDPAAAAARIVNRILDQADLLASYPHAGRTGRVPGTRELVIPNTPFILPYRVREEAVELLAVFHGAQQWPESFQ